jgi:iron complex transport system substrate-binding protein
VRLLGLLGALLALVACSAPGPEPGGANERAEEWSFTDDLGTTVRLDEPPTRIAGLTDVIASLWNYGVEPVAAFGYTGIAQDKRFAGRDLGGVTELGRAYGQIDLEALAAADPDVIVTHVYPVDAAGTIDPAAPLYGFADRAQQDAVARIAPIVAIRMDGSAVEVIDRTVDLALALGADPAAVDRARGEYAAATDRLRTAASSGLQVLVVAAYPAEGFYVAKAPDDPALTSYADRAWTSPGRRRT